MLDTPTQIEDISNKVYQEKIGDRRLRNEEIRRQMGKEWTPPSQSTGSQPSTLQNIFNNDGNVPTEASTYRKLKNNVDALGLSNHDSISGTPPTNTGRGNIPSWAPTAVGLGMSLGGAGQYAGLGQAAVNFARGNTSGGTGGLAQWMANQTPLGKITGVPGLIGTTVNGLMRGDSWEKMAGDASWGAGKALLGKAIPGLGLADLLMGLGTWGVGALTGKDMSWDPRRGLNNLFGDGLVGVPKGFEGYGNGFFGANALGGGIKNPTAGSTISSSSSGYTPPNYSLGQGVSLNSNTSTPQTQDNNSSLSYTTPNYSLGQGVSLGGYSPSSDSGDE